MAKQKKKFYVVWKGRNTGIFDNWDDCFKQINEFQGAVYKSFKSFRVAEEAFSKPPDQYFNSIPAANELPQQQLILLGDPVTESIAVDGAWNIATGVIEYQGAETATGKILFHTGPFEDGTNNIAAFLAIVHALAYCKQRGISIPIYSDNRNAINWVKEKRHHTTLLVSDRNYKLFEILDRAEKWLATHEYPNSILKWETTAWGKNPADFGWK